MLGLSYALGYGFLGIDVGGTLLSSREAWDLGVTQPYVASGVLLAVFAVFLRAGAKWAPWAIVAWCPVTIAGGMAWTLSRGVGNFDLIEFLVLGIPLTIGWVWVMGRQLVVRKPGSDGG